MSTLPDLLLQHARERPDAPAIREKRRGRWDELSWSQYADRVKRVAHGLRELGVQPGDRVAIHGENRPEWVIADLAIQGIGAVSVGVYPTSPAAEVEYLLAHSETVVLIAEDEEQLDKALAVRERLPDLRKIVLIDPRNVRELGDVMTWEQLEDHEPLEGFGEGLDPGETAVIVYTSGTTGPPKGAMLTHHNLTWAAGTFQRAFGTGPDDEVLSYLPLCHVAERLGTVINGLGTGYVVNFGEGGESFAQDLRDVQPTLFAAVPRVWEKMLATVEIKMADASPVKRWSYRTATRLGSGRVGNA
ncbi:MAG TPA: AMP-binding protein, partial [Solirubrobacteraceae bacterium]|nr:AMP-binding protein [Solirubrobacteraceae bacterium]